jgi:hypothetical protein
MSIISSMKSVNLRKQHIAKFRTLSPEKRLAWALHTGWDIRNSLSEKAKKIQDHCRNGGKTLLRNKLEHSS